MLADNKKAVQAMNEAYNQLVSEKAFDFSGLHGSIEGDTRLLFGWPKKMLEMYNDPDKDAPEYMIVPMRLNRQELYGRRGMARMYMTADITPNFEIEFTVPGEYADILSEPVEIKDIFDAWDQFTSFGSV